MERPVSVKGVCALPDGRVLLCRNHRGDWELPGGRPEPEETDSDCLIRELWEETGLTVRVDRPLGTLAFEVVPERWVDVVGYSCALATSSDPGSVAAPGPVAEAASDRARVPAPAVSDEHTAVAFLEVNALGIDELPAVYHRLIARARTRGAT